MITWTVPPSTLQAAPATYEARCEQRKTIASAISSTSARRPIGRLAPAAASASSRAHATGELGGLVEEAAGFHPQLRLGGPGKRR